MCWRGSSTCRLGDIQLPKSDAVSVDGRIAGSTRKPEQLFLCSFCGSSELGELLPTISVLIPFMASVPNRHGSIFPFLID